jgi:hypothetical protein
MWIFNGNLEMIKQNEACIEGTESGWYKAAAADNNSWGRDAQLPPGN